MADITVENLSFSYPETDGYAIENINIQIRQGEFILICGESGCGKTTLLKHFKSVLTPGGTRSGRVLIDGEELSDIPEKRQAELMGYVFQSPDDQIVTDKVWHELAFAGESMKLDPAAIRLRCGEIAGYFDLQDKYYSPVNELSGGQKQILNLASVMTLSPDILILDEPVSQLDPIAADNFLSTVRKLNDDLGITVIISEHSLDRVFSMADRVIVMDGGRIVSCGTPQETADKFSSAEHRFFYMLPAPAQAAALCGLRGKLPLTVKDGRRLITSLDFSRELIAPEEKKCDKKAPALEFDEVYFRYSRSGDDVLKSFSMTLGQGEILGIVGGNGTGKSTALKAAAGLIFPHSGRIRVNSKKVKNADSLRRFTAYLPQEPSVLFVKDTVREELAETVRKDSTAPGKADIERVTEDMKLENLLDKHPFDLSGGESQRLGIAKILLAGADIILLDEPAKGMDPQFKNHFGKILRSLADAGRSIAVVSHDMEFAARIADRCIMTFDGGVISENVPRRFFAGNHFYTTAVNRTVRGVFPDCILTEEAAALCLKQTEKK